MKATKGPWRFHPCLTASENHKGFAIYSGVLNIAKAVPLDHDGVKGEANAQLISAAPDLYEALNRIIAELPSNRDWLDPVLEAQAKDALEKAIGQSGEG